MYPLLLFSLTAAAVAAEKIIQLRMIAVRKKLFLEITSLYGSGGIRSGTDFRAGLREKWFSRSGKISLALIQRTAEGGFRSEKGYELEISKITLECSERIHLLDLAGKISPMTGLTGTVIGLARAFQSVSSSGRTGNAAVLAGGIWEAMITTIAGLLIAIPAIIAAHMLRNSFRKHIERLRHCCSAVFRSPDTEKSSK